MTDKEKPMPTSTWLPDAIAAAERKILALAERRGGAFLHATRDGRYGSIPAEEWTSGFWPGLLLLLYRRSNLGWLLEREIEAEAELERAVVDERLFGFHHDVGFQFGPTAVARYKLTGDHTARRRCFLAAQLLMGRFNPASGAIEAWNGAGRSGVSIVDTMMNLPLLFWAADEFGLPRFRNVAESHADLAQREFVRPDGTTNHIIRFDDRTGARLETIGGQGYGPGSAWSRGQSWALYGFALAHRYTRRSEFLTTAQRVADSFLAGLPADVIPPWDFRDPEAGSAARDSSAAAIAASGLLELAVLVESREAARYREAAIRLLLALSRACFSADDPEQDGLLLHATGNLPAGENIDVSLIYGDFYYFEALLKLDGRTDICW